MSNLPENLQLAFVRSGAFKISVNTCHSDTGDCKRLDDLSSSAITWSFHPDEVVDEEPYDLDEYGDDDIEGTEDAVDADEVDADVHMGEQPIGTLNLTTLVSKGVLLDLRALQRAPGVEVTVTFFSEEDKPMFVHRFAGFLDPTPPTLSGETTNPPNPDPLQLDTSIVVMDASFWELV